MNILNDRLQNESALAEPADLALLLADNDRSPAPQPTIQAKRRLHGHIDLATRTEISGWVWDPQNPQERISLELTKDDVVVAITVADIDRPGLTRAGIGDGRHAFRIELTDGLLSGDRHVLNLRCAHSSAPVPGTPIDIAALADFRASSPENSGATTASATPEIGYCDLVTSTRVDGWAIDPETPDIPAVLDAFIDGLYVATFVCNLPRFNQANGTSKLIGFRVEVPARFRDGLEHTIEFRKPAGQHITLRDATGVHGYWTLPPAAPSPAEDPVVPAVELPAGLIDAGLYRGELKYHRNVVEGWIRKANSDSPVEIRVVADGLEQWRGLARRRVQTDTDGTTATGHFGFRVLLRNPSAPCTSRRLEITDTNGSHVLGGPFLIPYGDQYLGFLEVIERSPGRLRVCGWCIDAVHPSVRVPLRVESEGRVLATGETSLYRDGMSAVGFDAPYAGFAIETEEFDDAIPLDTIRVTPGFSLTPLSRLDPLEIIDTRNAAQAAETSEAPPQYCKPDDVIEGTIDQITRNIIRGWARNKTNPEAVVVLDCYIDGILFSTTAARRFRADLKKHFNDHGFHEYLFELSPTAGFFNPGKIAVAPRVGTNQIKQKIDVLDNAIRPGKTVQPREKAFLRNYRVGRKGFAGTLPRISLIVINRNGRELLSSFLLSFYEFNTYKDYEILIIDHQSSDDSYAVVQSWTKRLNVTWHLRDNNYSFSDSNNFGVRNSTGDVVLFVNNDITFHQDILAGVVTYLNDPKVGCVGIKLFDDSPVPRHDLQHPIQHLGIHFGPAWKGASLEAFESRYAPMWHRVVNEPIEAPGVTGAFMACRRDEFLALGGFDERYFYGFEDVDLCLKYMRSGASIVAANDLAAAHLRGFSRARMDKRYNYARERNKEVFNEEWGFWLRRRVAEERFEKPGFWTAAPVKIAFVVTEATETTLAGDYFTALELASQISAQYPCECTFLEVLAKNEYQLAGFDVVIAMRDDYDPRKITDAAPHLIRVAWVRNWFDRFAEREGSANFDAVWASSQSACDYIAEKLGKPVMLLPIATNAYKFKAGKPDAALKSDYCFTGSYWGLNREIVQLLDPEGLPFEFAIFGTGWDAVPHLAPYSRGPLPYKRMPDVYANTKIVIDDANHVTKSWGAVNSRVFDALCAGALVITNGKAGAENLFEGLLPTFDTPQGLQDLLWTYLSDEPARLRKVAELRQFVLDRHTYQQRARTVWGQLSHISREQLRIAIKIGAPNEKVRNEWGDYHFAASMKYYFEQLGHSVRIDCLDSWYAPVCAGDDAVIVLRGLSKYKLVPSQINLMWNISHPDTISPAEYQEYDHVFIASELHAESLRGLLGDKVSVLLQCTDPRFFNPEVPLLPKAPGALFVGNSRNVLRRIVADGIAAGLPLEIYGTRWEGLIPESYVRGENIPNRELGSYYRSASVLLNDHWENMRVAGFMSNRLFDGAACGARIISDEVPGLGEQFAGVVRAYATTDHLADCASHFEVGTEETARARLELAMTVLREHVFGSRVKSILERIGKILSEKHSSSGTVLARFP